MKLKQNDKIVFFGDSVTDTCHQVKSEYPLGSGYVLMVNNHINTNFCDLNIQIYNKGINGNRTKDLVARLQEDVLDLHPNFVFILIGVNDAWRGWDQNDPTSVEQFIKNYKTILDGIKNTNPNTQIVMMTPFLITSIEWVLAFKEDLDEKTKAIIELAKEYQLPLIPLHELMPQYEHQLPLNMVSNDGIHPSIVGHALIADQVLKYLLG